MGAIGKRNEGAIYFPQPPTDITPALCVKAAAPVFAGRFIRGPLLDFTASGVKSIWYGKHELPKNERR